VKVIRTTTFYVKTPVGYEITRKEQHECDYDELPIDHWYSETMHVGWEWAIDSTISNTVALF